jgi:uncharacterized membrane protein YecN with MAPEG domain
MTVTLLYASLLTILFVFLALRIGSQRLNTKIFFGAPDDEWAQKVRAHGNLAEHLPPFLILLALFEMNNAPEALLHLFGLLFLLCRFLHAFGLYTSAEFSFHRAVGAMGSWAIMLAMACYGLYLAL